MKARLCGFFLLGLVAGIRPEPAHAVQTSSEQVAGVEAAQAGFGRWIATLSEIQQPVNGVLLSLQNRFQTITGSADIAAALRGARAATQRDIATIDATTTILAALETPDFAALGLPTDLQPAALKQQAIQMNGHLRRVLESFLPMFEAAARRDLRAAQAANAQSMNSVRLLLESQLLMARATQASFPRGGGLWEIYYVPVLYQRAMLRFVGSAPGVAGPRVQPELAQELLTLAAEMDQAATRGDRQVAAELTAITAALGQMSMESDDARRRLAQRQIRVITHLRGYLAVGRDLAETLRREAPALSRTALTPERFMSFAQSLYPFRNRMVEIEREASLELSRQ